MKALYNPHSSLIYDPTEKWLHKRHPIYVLNKAVTYAKAYDANIDPDMHVLQLSLVWHLLSDTVRALFLYRLTYFDSHHPNFGRNGLGPLPYHWLALPAQLAHLTTGALPKPWHALKSKYSQRLKPSRSSVEP